MPEMTSVFVKDICNYEYFNSIPVVNISDWELILTKNI